MAGGAGGSVPTVKVGYRGVPEAVWRLRLERERMEEGWQVRVGVMRKLVRRRVRRWVNLSMVMINWEEIYAEWINAIMLNDRIENKQSKETR